MMTLANMVAYLFGMSLGVLFRAARWQQTQPANTPWIQYWYAKRPEIVMSVIVAVLAFGGWATGLLAGVATAIHAQVTGSDHPFEVQIIPYTSAIAGFVLDLVGYGVVLKFWRKAEPEE